MGCWEVVLSGLQWAVMWGAGQASSRGRLARAPWLPTKGLRGHHGPPSKMHFRRPPGFWEGGAPTQPLSAFGARPGLVWGQPRRCKLSPNKDLSLGSQGMVTAPDFIGRISLVVARLLPGLTRKRGLASQWRAVLH